MYFDIQKPASFYNLLTRLVVCQLKNPIARDESYQIRWHRN